MKKIIKQRMREALIVLSFSLISGHVWADTAGKTHRVKDVTGVESITQENTVKGSVINSKGETLIGVSIRIQGTSTGTITNLDGEFSIAATKGAVLEVSYIGYVTQNITVTGNAPLKITLQEDTKVLDEVVVTAMGIERKAKSLTYATQRVSGEELTRAKDPNLINSLQGKTAGLVITPNASGAGGSSKLLIRGNKSAQGNNQPLIVIDGMPMANNSSTQLADGFGGRDGGDALSNLNPDDIASINVLKGASAAALYGSMAANGVVLITTKKGSEGTLRIDVSSNVTFEKAMSLPRLQSEYGATVSSTGALSQDSWGDKISGEQVKGSNRLDEFFRTGTTYINSVALSGGTENIQGYASYANTRANGIMPTNDFQRHNITLKETLKLLDNKLTITGTMNYIVQKGNNRHEAGQYRNPLTGLYTFPANGDFNYYKENFAQMNSALGYENQIWYRDVNNDFSANPYWVINRNPHKENRERVIVSGSARYTLTDFLNIQGRLNFDKSSDTYERKMYAGTSNVFVGTNGAYLYEMNTDRQMYGDLMGNFNKTFADFDVNASMGCSFTDAKKTYRNASPGGDMYIPNVFTGANGNKNGNSNTETRTRLNSLFGTVQIGYKDMLYLDATGRNDWSSTLAFTDNASFFYPSVGLTAIVSEMTKMPEFINLFKVRASYSIVGNGMPAYITNPIHTINSTGAISFKTETPFKEMKPEKLHSVELGFDLSMFDNAFDWDFTFYKSNNKNQYFKMNVPSGTGFSSYYFNAGDIQNTGFETTMSYIKQVGNFAWKTSVNLSYNENKIKELDNERLPDNRINIGTIQGYELRLVKDGSYGDIYSKVLKRDDKGVIKVNVSNIPEMTDELVKVGNVNPKWGLGWSNTFTYKNFQLYALIDGRMGGNYIDATEGMLDLYGVGQKTADARNNGGVDLGNGTKIPAKNYYTTVSSKGNMGEEYVYSATNFRMRELSLGYTLRNLFGVSKDLSVSLIGRNLFFLYKDAPCDPEVSMSTLNGFSGSNYFALPSTRSFGFNIKATF